MNILTKINAFKLPIFSLYSTATVKHKDEKFEIEVDKPKPIRPLSKDMLLNRFNINMLEFPEIINNELVEQTLAVSKEVDKLMNAREHLDRSTMLSRLSASGIVGVTLPGIFIEDRYTWMMVARLIESLTVDIDYTLFKYLPQTLVCQSVLRGGNQEQRDFYLKSLSNGEVTGCVAMNEGLSDMVDYASIGTTAMPDKDSWIINGRKSHVFNYINSDIVIVFAKTHTGDVAPFIVDSKSKGLTHDESVAKKSCVDLNFVNVKVPRGNILSSELSIQLPRYIASINNVCVSAMCASLTKSFVRLVNEFVCSRCIFGKPLSQFESTQEDIVNLTADSYSAESMAYFMAGTLDGLEDVDLFIESTLAKNHSLEALRRCVDVSLKIVGLNYLSDSRFQTLHDTANTLLRNQVSTKRSKIDTTKESIEYMVAEFRKEKFRPIDKLKLYIGSYKIHGDYQDNIIVNSFKYNLHPRLGKMADPVYGYYHTLNKILKRLSKSSELLKDEFCLSKVSSVLVDSLMLVAVLGRASRSIAIGLRNSDLEVRLSEVISKAVSDRIKRNVDMLKNYPDNVGQWKNVIVDLKEDVHSSATLKTQ